MPFQPIIPIFQLALNNCNDTSASGFTDLRTLQPVNAGGQNLGDWMDLTEAEANALSYTTNGTLHAGRYRRVQVDSGATASNVKTGTIGYMVAGGQPQLNLVTSYDKSLVGVHPVIFLNTVTPGNYCYVQEAACGGVGNALCGATLTAAGTSIGGGTAAQMVNSTTNGVLDVPTVQEVIPNTIGLALDPPSPNTIIRVYLGVGPSQGLG
jgi:hypothetical protein